MTLPILPGDTGPNPELKLLNLRLKMACTSCSKDDRWMKKMAKFVTSENYSVYILDIKKDKVTDRFQTTYAIVKEEDQSCKFMKGSSDADGSHFKVDEQFYEKSELSKSARSVCDTYEIDIPQSQDISDEELSTRSMSPNKG